MLTPEVLDYMDRSVLCWLATANAHWQPNVSPKEIFAPWNNAVLVANIASPKTIKNLKVNPKVCLSFGSEGIPDIRHGKVDPKSI